MLAFSACTAYFYPHASLFVVGTAALLLLFIGIHNAWDIVTYHVFGKKQIEKESKDGYAGE
jgi:hypothetical protein